MRTYADYPSFVTPHLELGERPVVSGADAYHTGCVTAPSEAEETSAAYLAKTPLW